MFFSRVLSVFKLSLRVPLDFFAIAALAVSVSPASASSINGGSLDLESDLSQYAFITDASQSGLDLSEDFTVEWWQRLESPVAGGSDMIVISKDGGTPNRSYEVRLRDVSGDTVELLTSSDGTNATTFHIRVATTFTIGQWQHFAVTYDASAGQMELFANGMSQGFATGGVTSIFNSVAPINIGRRPSGAPGPEHFDGNLDDLRVWNHLRTDSEIIADFDQELTGLEAGLIGYWQFDGDYQDLSGNGNHLTPANSPVLSTEVPFGASNGNSLDLESDSSQYAFITDTSQSGLDLSGDFTVEWWQKLESPVAGGSDMIVISKDGGTPNRSYEVRLRDVSGDTVELLTSSNGTNVTTFHIRVATTFAIGQWQHFAVTYDASAGQMELFANGMSQGFATGGVTSIFNSVAPINIGRRPSGAPGPEHFDGNLDDLRIWSHVRTSFEINTDFDQVLTGLEAGLIGYWQFDGDYQDLSGNGNHLTPTNSPVFSTDVPFMNCPPGAFPIFTDGFESGDTTAWSSRVP